MVTQNHENESGEDIFGSVTDIYDLTQRPEDVFKIGNAFPNDIFCLK